MAGIATLCSVDMRGIFSADTLLRYLPKIFMTNTVTPVFQKAPRRASTKSPLVLDIEPLQAMPFTFSSLLPVICVLFALGACSSAPTVVPHAPGFQADTDFPVIELTHSPGIEVVLEEREWWSLGGYEPQPILSSWGHGWSHGPRCLPPFRIIATLSTPRKHPFIREDEQQQRELEALLATEMNVQAAQFDLAPLSIEEMEKSFLEAALPRLKDHAEWVYRPEPCAWGFVD